MSPSAHAAAKVSRFPRPTSASRGRPIQFGFIPSLDGLRAVAVLGVMLYHGGAPILGGGFLTIDVFFVLSGFLITSLLVGEWRKRLTIHLGQFWTRRARRLLPALLVMLIGVALYAKLLATPGEFSNLRLDSLSSLFYVANWHFIFAGTNYFNLTAQPSPLQHMWSLSIEEQFYIVWPPVVLLMLFIGNKLRPTRKLWPLFAASSLGAIASAIDMRLLYHGPQSVMRIYEGTDTRSQDLLVGASLAVGMAIWAQHRKKLPLAVGTSSQSSSGNAVASPMDRKELRRARGVKIKPIAAWEITPQGIRMALQILGWTTIAIYAYLWSHMTGPNAFLFKGGYFLVAIGVAIVIFCSVTNQAGSVAKALGNPVFQYVGKISYGTYLWHFPLFAVLDAERMHLYGYPLLFVRIGVTLLVATASFYLVEEPVRRGKMRSLTEWRAWLTTSGAFLAVVFVTVLATLPTTAEAATGVSHAVGSQYSGPPVKVTLFGDSVAFTAGFAIAGSQGASEYDVNFDAEGQIGCGVVRSTEYQSQGIISGQIPACNSSSPPSQQWPALWAGALQRFHPNVTILLAGRWEVIDRLINGQWLHIGEPAYDAILKQSLEQAVQVGTSTGALMILETSPCFDSGEQPNGEPWPEDSAARLDDYNTILRSVAAEYPQKTEVQDLGGAMCPGGQYQATVDGVLIRKGDGIHIVETPAAGQWLANEIFPEAVRLGRLQMNHQPATTPTTLPPLVAPTTTLPIKTKVTAPVHH